MNLKKDLEASGEQMTLFSLEASRNYASHTAKQESDLERKTNAIYGRKCLEQFERFNHVGSWAKTFSALLIGQTGWFSKRCKLTWKIKGTKYRRMYFQLRPSTLPTDATGFGLLPTVKTQQDSKPQRKLTNGKNISYTTGREYGVHLSQLATAGLLPTPTAMEYKDSQLTPEQAKKLDKGGRVLRRLGTIDMLPDGKASQLNPLFVMEMMGFPPNWTLLPFLSGETNQSKPEEMQ